MWGRYELIERIDAGPVAETWRARNVETNALVALKKLDGDLASSPELVATFSAVSESLRSPPHWDLVAVLDVGEVHAEPYSARTWIDGVSLSQLLQSTAKRKIPVLPPPLALTVVLSIIDVLDKLHGASLVHGHLVSRNVFVLANGSVKVTDAGLTRVIEAAIAGQSVMATLWPQHDAAPEQMGTDAADARADVFAVAALLFELLTSSRPTERAEDGSIIIPPATAQFVPPIFTPILGRALSEQRELRHNSVRELGAELRTIAQMGYQLDAPSVGLAVSALITHERMPLPPPVTELLSRFALMPEPPPNARRTTGDQYLVAVPTPPPLPAGTLPPRTMSKPNDLVAVPTPLPQPTPPDVDTQPSIRTKSGETQPASELEDQLALRAKSGETKVPPELSAESALRAKSGGSKVPPELSAEPALRAKSGGTKVPPTLAGESKPPLSMTAPLPWSDEAPSFDEAPPTSMMPRPALGEDDPQTRILAGGPRAASSAAPAALGEDDPQTRILADAPSGDARVSVPLDEAEPGPTRIVGEAVALADAEPGPTNVKVGASLGASPNAPTGALPSVAPPTNPRTVPPRSGSRVVPMMLALLALGGAGFFTYKRVLPPPEATVDITSTPPGADVLVNGELTERVTPTKLALPADKPYVIELQLPGKLPWSDTVTPTVAAPLVIRAELKGLPSQR